MTQEPPPNSIDTWQGSASFPPDAAILDAELVPEPEPPRSPPPATQGRPGWYVPLWLFLATCGCTFWIGGPLYCLAVMTILVCHEMGHYIQARRYGCHCTLPYFIPMPLGILGTLGAVIGMSPDIPNRRALFDIGISGPLAGLVPTMVCIVIGIHRAEIIPMQAGTELGEPLLMQWLIYLMRGPIPEGYTTGIGPIGMACWVGLLITSLNLFPLGQLDGGHVLHALLGKRSHRIAECVMIGIMTAVFFVGYYWWVIMMVLLLVMGHKHPPTRDDRSPLGWPRQLLGWLTLAFLIISFTPSPLAEMKPFGLPDLLRVLWDKWPWL